MSLHTAPTESTPLSAMFSLQGKVCLITGGNRGIGYAIAQGYAEAGAAGLAIIHSSSKTSSIAEARADELRAAWPSTEVAVYACDVSDPVAIETTTNRVAAEFGRLDVVVVNAGLYSDAKALDMAPEEAQKVTAVNYFGALYTAQAAARVMRANGTPGKIIFTASINGHMILRPQRESIYSASKAAVCHLTRALAVEWAEYNIQVNAVSPGYIDTEMNDIMIEKYPDQVGNWLKDCPAGRFCKVWELKGVYVFLASQASSYVTGADYVVDGGHTCH